MDGKYSRVEHDIGVGQQSGYRYPHRAALASIGVPNTNADLQQDVHAEEAAELASGLQYFMNWVSLMEMAVVQSDSSLVYIIEQLAAYEVGLEYWSRKLGDAIRFTK
jgi:hypothetical protein